MKKLLSFILVLAFVFTSFIGKAQNYCQANFTYTITPGSTQFNFHGFNAGSTVSNTVTFLWNFHDGSSSNLENPVHSFPNGFGNVCLTITTATGCTSTFCDSVMVNTNPCQIFLTSSITNSTGPNNPDGAIHITVTGGTAPYAYHWSNNATTQNLGNLAAGTYTVVVTDANGCSYTGSFTVSVQTAPALIASVVTNPNTSTTGTCNGSATFAITGGFPPYTVSLNNGTTITGNIFEHLCAGTYVATVYDSHQNHVSITFVITNNIQNCQANFTYSITASGQVAFHGFNVSGNATNACTFSWNFHDGSISSLENPIHSFPNPLAYVCLTITTSTGCTSTFCDSIFIQNPGSIIIIQTSSTPNSNPTLCNGTASFSISGGFPPYTVYLNNSVGTTATGTIFEHLCAGNYILNVYDSHQNQASYTFTIINSTSPMTIVTTQTTNVSGPNVCDGTADFIVQGGISPYVYHFNGVAINGPHLNGLCAGTYIFTVVDAQGISASVTFVILANSITPNDSLLFVYLNSLQVTNPTNCNGVVNAEVFGGTAPYLYSWNISTAPVNSNMSSLYHLCSGFYCVTVTDATGMTASACTNISNQNTTVIPTDTVTAQADTCIFNIAIDSVFIGNVYSTASGVVVVQWVVISGNGQITYNSTYNINTPGTYLITLVINCQGVKTLKTFSQIHTISQSDLTITDLRKLATQSSVYLYPNPTEEFLNITSEKPMSHIYIYNRWGQCIYTSNTQSKHYVVNVLNLIQGVYLLKIDMIDNSFITRSFIKTNK